MRRIQFFPSQGPPPEDHLFRRGYRRVAGVDEAGRGPLAGPVVSAAVVLSKGHPFKGVLDSKQLRPRQRDHIFEMILAESITVGVGIVDQWEIDRINIHRASLKAMEIAVNNLKSPADFLLIDGLYTTSVPLPQKAVKYGDILSCAIGAASVVAKVIRDRIMERYDEAYPLYGFAKNKGYGTREHREAIQQHGYCSLHRKSFSGVAAVQKMLF